jgi:hypothetical protein
MPIGSLIFTLDLADEVVALLVFLVLAMAES